MLLVLLDVLAVGIVALEQTETHQLSVIFSSNQLQAGAHGIVIEQGLVRQHLESCEVAVDTPKKWSKMN